MTTPTRNEVRDRVLVMLGGLPQDPLVIETATRLATEAGAELFAILAEDVDLKRLAGLPFAREISVITASTRPIDLPAMELSLRVRADRTRRTLERSAQLAGVNWTFTLAADPSGLSTVAGETTGQVLVIARQHPWFAKPRNAAMLARLQFTLVMVN